MDLSPRNLNYNMCAKSDLSEVDLPIVWRSVEAQGASDLHRTNDIGFIANVRLRRSSSNDLHRIVDHHRAVDPHHDRGTLDRVIAIVHSPKAPSNGGENLRKNSTIAVRSSHDRAAIVALSLWNQCHDTQCMVPTEDGKRKVHDRGPIASRSWTDHRLIVTTIMRDRGFF